MIGPTGAGTGVAVDTGELRAVRLPGTGQPAVHGAEVVTRPGSDGVLDALIRLATRIGTTTAEPVRLAWSHATLEIADITGADAARAAISVRRLSELGCASIVTMATPRHRLAVGIVWDHDAAESLADTVRSAGFTDVAVEPASLATRRLAGHPLLDVALRPDVAAAYGAALAAAGRAGVTGPLRRLVPPTDDDLAAVPWILERVTEVRAGAGGSGAPGRWRRWWARIAS